MLFAAREDDWDLAEAQATRTTRPPAARVTDGSVFPMEVEPEVVALEQHAVDVEDDCP
ncbi:MAG: hypothetical protein ACM3ZF_13435 [Mycobacterium leprae]